MLNRQRRPFPTVLDVLVVAATVLVTTTTTKTKKTAFATSIWGVESEEDTASTTTTAKKLELWSWGAYQFPLEEDELDFQLQWARWKNLQNEKLSERRRSLHHHDFCDEQECGVWQRLRGGDTTTATTTTLEELSAKYGQAFRDALKENEREHEEDCAKSCQSFYCANETSAEIGTNDVSASSFTSYSFGPLPPEDFSGDFGFPLDLIQVTRTPLFSAEEADQVVQQAEAEGLSQNEYPSGKYKLGGDWLTELPQTRAWFNEKLRTSFFPILSRLFPEIISSPRVLRAHSVSLLKYNTTHSRTDVHVDNGILALTVAMTPQSEYQGGGTYFEHFQAGDILEMDVGHATFRPGSIRHGGHAVTRGVRYILGAFLLLENRVEHVRRLKNRGARLRQAGDLENAARHFEWALAMNPKCATCLKDWAEIHMMKKEHAQAEDKIRQVLHLVEERDSDAWFTLGVILSAQERHEEAIEAYRQSVNLNGDDYELCYNLAIKLGSQGQVEEERQWYERATTLNPHYAGAWINWGVSLAEGGNLQDAEPKFKEAIACADEVVTPKAMVNLAMVYQQKATNLAAEGNLSAAKSTIGEAGQLLDQAKPLLMQAAVRATAAAATGGRDEDNNDSQRYLAQWEPHRIQVHRLTGSILAGLQDLGACEAEFRQALQTFPHIPGVYEMLARILEVSGKADEAKSVRDQLNTLVANRKGTGQS